MVEIFLCWEFSPDFGHALIVSVPRELPSLESPGLMGTLQAVQFLPALVLSLEPTPHPVSPWFILVPGMNLCLSQPA